MRRKIVPYIRLLVILLPLLLGLVGSVLAVEPSLPTGARTAVEQASGGAPQRAVDSGLPLDAAALRRQGGDPPTPPPPEQACKIYVNAYLLNAPPIAPLSPPPDYGLSFDDATRTAPGPQHQIGDTLSWAVVLQNSTGDAECPTVENLTNVHASLAFLGTNGPEGNSSVDPVPLIFPGADGVLEPGQIAWGVVDYVLLGTLNGNLDVQLTALAKDSSNGNVLDRDEDWVTVLGPGFRVVSFTPDPASAGPGTPVDFTLTIENTRPGTTIDEINVTSPVTLFIAACDGLGKWTVTQADPDPSPGAGFGYKDTAVCTISGVPIPDNPAPESFSLTGDITVHSGTFAVTETAASSPVTVTVPRVEVTKVVSDISRGGQTVQPPAEIGDVIHYLITVRNPGEVTLENLFVMDSLTGPIILPPDTTLAAGATLPITAAYTIVEGGQDPLTNIVTVTARGQGFTGTVDTSAAASVDIADSALKAELKVYDSNGTEISAVPDRAQTVTYQLDITNTGATTITGIDYVTLGGLLRTVGTPPPLNITLAPGTHRLVSWSYALQPTDPDPLVNTVRVRGRDENNRLVTAQTQVILDIDNPAIDLAVSVAEPATNTVLRGGQVIFEITVTNGSNLNPVCQVVINQYRRDPDTGVETPIMLGIPLTWPTATAGRLEAAGSGDESATAVVTYLVTGSDKDPLQMIFEVNANDCTNPSPQAALTDRTSKTLDLSDVQVNASLVASLGAQPLGPDDAVPIGDTVTFTFAATNVGTIPLKDLSAQYCLRHRVAPADLNCDAPSTLVNLTPKGQDSSIGFSETTTGSFTVTIQDQDANGDFLAEVTLFGTDNQANQVSIKAATTVNIATKDLGLELSGPQEAVMGDTEQFAYTVINNTNATLTNVRVYNLLVPDASTPTGFKRIDSFDPAAGGTVGVGGRSSGTFDYLIVPNVGITGDILKMKIRVTAKIGTTNALANDTLDVLLIPMIGVQKTGPATLVAGQPITYQVVITNQSKNQLLTVTGYEDPLIQNYQPPSPQVPIGPEDFGPTLQTIGQPWPGGVVGQLPPQTSVIGQFTLPEVQAGVSPLVNVFSVRGTRPDGTVVSNFDDHSVEIACPIQFVVQVTNLDDDPDDVLGEELRWEISAVNISLDTITGLQISESLNWGQQQPDITWPDAPGTLAPGQIARLAAFTKLITHEYYRAGDDYMEDNLSATFAEVSGASQCTLQKRYPVYSPIWITKTADPYIAFTGDTVTYTVTLENVTEANDPANPANPSYKDFYVTAYDSLLQPNPIPFDYNGTGQKTTAGLMTPGEKLTETLTYVVQASDPEELINVASAEFPDPVNPDIRYITDYKNKIFTGNPLKLTKIPSVTQAVPGTMITYDYSVTNVSPWPVSNITLVDDTLPDGDLIPGRTGGLAALDPGQSVTLTDIEYLIPVNTGDPLVNTVTATGLAQLPDNTTRQVTNSLTVSLDITDPAVKVTKTVQDAETHQPLPDDLPVSLPDGDGMPEAGVGQYVEYCFNVKNSGEPTTYVDNIQLQDMTLGAGTLQPLFEDQVALLPGHTAEQTRLLNGGEEVNFCAPPIALQRSMGDPVVNTVTLRGKSSNNLDVYHENKLAVDLVGSDLVITKAASKPLAFIGEELTYTIRVENRNATSLIDTIEVMDAFNGSAPSPIPADAIDWSNNNNNETPGTLGPAGYALYTYTYTVRATDPDPLVNIATVTGQLSGGEVVDSTRSAVAITASQLIVRKTAVPDVANPEDEVQYTISITNVGSIRVSNVRATDSRFAGALTLTDTTLDPFETAYIFYTMPMPGQQAISADPTLDPFINTITVVGDISDPSGNPLVGAVTAQATESVDILQPGLRIVKSPVTGAATQGELVTYNITVSNVAGPGQVIKNIKITDLSVTPNVVVDLDTACAAPVDPAACKFKYGPEPYQNNQPNPNNGQYYNPSLGLAYHEQLIGQISVQVPADLTLPEFTNVAQAEGNIGTTPVRDRSSATIDIREEGIQVQKTASVSAAPVGAPVTYTVTVTNIGGVAVSRLILADPGMPGGSKTVQGTVFPDSPDIDDNDSATLDPGEVYTETYSHTLGVQDGDPYVNRVTVSARTTTNVTVLNSAETTVDVQTAQVAVEKYVCVESAQTLPDPCTTVVNTGDTTPDTVTYYLHFHNTSLMKLQNISVIDTLVPSSTFETIPWPQDPNALAPDDGQPGGDDELWFTYTYTVRPGDPDPLNNMVTVTAETATVPVAQAQDTATASLSLVSGDLRLTKTATVGGQPVTQVAPGDTVTYSLTVENTNASGIPITQINVYDPLSPQRSSPVCTIDALAAGTSQACGSPYTHVVGLADTSPLTNTATADGQESGLPVSDSATVALPIMTPGGLSVSKTADVSISSIGQTVTFTYRIENTGAQVVDQIVVVDSDPAIGSTGFSAPWKTFLAPGEVMVRTATRTLTAQDPDPYTNTVTVTGRAGTQRLLSQATESVAIANGELVVTNVPSAAFVTPGGKVTFAYTITNLGTDPATDDLSDLTVADNLGPLTPPAPTLAAGASMTVYRTVQVPLGQTTPVLSVVSVSATAADNSTRFDSATAEVPVTAGGVLVTKSANRVTALPGQTITYQIHVTNIGNETLTQFNVQDPMITQLSPQPPASLAPGAFFTLTGTLLVPDTGMDGVTNTVTVTATATPSQTVYTDTASASVAILERPDAALALTKAASRTDAKPGESVTYTFTVRNVSDSVQTEIAIEDDLLAGSPFAVPDLAPGNTAVVTQTATIPADYAQPLFENTATVQTGTGENLEVQDTASASVLVTLLELTKTGPTTPVAPGDTISYTFSVKNVSLSDVTGAAYSLADPGVTFQSPLPPINGGATVQITGTYALPSTYAQSTYTNTAQLLMDEVVVDTAQATVQVGTVALTFTKTGPDTPVAPGDTINYTFTITNTGTVNVPANGYTIVDPGVTLPGTLPAVPAGQSATVDATYTLPADYAQATYVNNASLTIGGVEVDTATATVNVTLPGELAVEGLAVTQSGNGQPGLIKTGQNVGITFTLHNTSTETITLDNPAYTIEWGNTSLTDQTCPRTLPATMPTTLAAGASVNVQCVYLPPMGAADPANAGFSTPIDVIVTASGTLNEEPVSGTDTVTVGLVDLQLEVTLEVLKGTTPVTSVLPGDVVTYRITLRNRGSSPLGCDATVTDAAIKSACQLEIDTLGSSSTTAQQFLATQLAALNTQLKDVVLDPSSDSTTDDEVSVTTAERTVGAAEGTHTYTVTATGGYFDAALNLTVAQAQFYTVHDDYTVSLTVQTAASILTVSITAAPNPPTFGKPITYTVTIHNTSTTTTVSGLTASYQISPLAAVPQQSDGIVLVSGDRAPQRQTSGTLTLNLTTLPPNGTATAILQKNEDQTKAYSFLVTVSGTIPNSTVPATASTSINLVPTGVGTATPTVDPATLDPTKVDPIVTKTAGATAGQPGGALVWTITIRNGGTSAFTNVTLQDTVPETMKLDSATTTRGATVVAGQLLTVTTGQMNPGDTITITVNTTISADAASPGTISNTACATKEGGTQQCATATVNLGPGVSGLPSTGIHGTPGARPWIAALGIVLAGALMLLMGVQLSNRKALLALAFLLIALVAMVGAVTLLLTRSEKPSPTEVGQAVSTATPAGAAPAADTPSAPGATQEAPVVAQGVPPSATPYIVPTPGGTRYLMIPKLADQFPVPIPIIELPIVDRQWDVSGLGYYVGWLDGTTWMDPQWGNTVLAAHVQLGFQNPGPFWGLGDLVPGDEIIITEGDVERHFIVSATRKVAPNDWTVTAPTDNPTLTLITCTEWDQSYGVFAQRMVVQAIPAS